MTATATSAPLVTEALQAAINRVVVNELLTSQLYFDDTETAKTATRLCTNHTVAAPGAREAVMVGFETFPHGDRLEVTIDMKTASRMLVGQSLTLAQHHLGTAVMKAYPTATDFKLMPTGLTFAIPSKPVATIPTVV